MAEGSSATYWQTGPVFLSSELPHEGRENRKPAWRWGPCRRPREPSLTHFLSAQAWRAGTSPSLGTAQACTPGPRVLSLGARPLCLPRNRRGRGFCWYPPARHSSPLPLGPCFPRGAEQPEHGPSSRGGVPVRAESEPGRSCRLAEKRRATLFVTGPSCGSDASRRLSHRLTGTSLRAETAFAPSLFPARSLTLSRCSKTP